MRNGIIYQIANWVIENLKYLNLVELFKWFTKKCYPSDTLLASRLGVDTFIIIKWIAVTILWYNSISNTLINYLIWYLIITNIYTYFYYHNWTKDLKRRHFNLKRIKRRFLNLTLAIAFNVFCFAYLFAVPFVANFQWASNSVIIKDSLLFSLANSITLDFPLVSATTEVGHTLTLIETFISFIFLTIILSNSIPQPKTD